MKKFLLGVVVALIAIPGVSSAASIKTSPVLWRTYASAYDTPGYRDSLYFSVASADVKDTSAAVSLQDLNWGEGGGAAADSLAWIAFHLVPRPSSAVTVASDSAYVTVQVSMDGSTWVSLTTAPTLNLIEAGTSNSFVAVFGQNVGAGSNVAIRNTLAMWNMVRFIHQSSDITGQFTAFVRYPRKE